MTHSELHRKKRTKNYVLLFLLLTLIALFFTVTMVKIANSSLPAAGTERK